MLGLPRFDQKSTNKTENGKDKVVSPGKFLVCRQDCILVTFCFQIGSGVSLGSYLASNFVQVLEAYDVFYPEEEEE